MPCAPEWEGRWERSQTEVLPIREPRHAHGRLDEVVQGFRHGAFMDAIALAEWSESIDLAVSRWRDRRLGASSPSWLQPPSRQAATQALLFPPPSRRLAERFADFPRRAAATR